VTGGLCTWRMLAVRGLAVARLDAARGDGVTDAVNAQCVGSAGSSRRAACDDDDLVAFPAAAHFEERGLYLPDHVTGVQHRGTMNVSTPQVSASRLRVAGSGVMARSGIGDRYLASRLTALARHGEGAERRGVDDRADRGCATDRAPVVVGTSGGEEMA
jgi:hypothetical protein